MQAEPTRRLGARGSWGRSPGRAAAIFAIGLAINAWTSPSAHAEPTLTAGSDHTCDILEARARCWGRNMTGQLGDGTVSSRPFPDDVDPPLPSDVDALASGADHTCAIADGGIWCWGNDENGGLGNDLPKQSSKIPVEVQGLPPAAIPVRLALGDARSCAIADGQVYCWGLNHAGQTQPGSVDDVVVATSVMGLAGPATDLAAGEAHTCALVNGGVQCWGNNLYGQLGQGNSDPADTPVDVAGLAPDAGAGVISIGAGDSHTCAVTAAGAVWCWGRNLYGQTGQPGVSSIRLPALVAGLSFAPDAVEAGGSQTCALGVGQVACWGANHEGQLGDGTRAHRSMPQLVAGLPADISELTVGEYHVCAKSASGLHCWGDNYWGQLGNGEDYRQRTPIPIGLENPVFASELSTGWYHTCGIRQGGAKCWGNNYSGQLGDGTNETRELPTALPMFPPLSPSITVRSIQGGLSHTCGLVDVDIGFPTKRVYCWGSDSFGVLGNGPGGDSPTPSHVTNINSFGTPTAVAVGAQHSCAIVSGELYCWGYGQDGQLGGGNTLNRSTPVKIQGLLGLTIEAVAAGPSHTCAVVQVGANERLFCWGKNDDGQLGFDGLSTVQSTLAVDLGNGIDIQAITAGRDFTCAIVNGSVWCWGADDSGQLGDGAGNSSGSVPRQIGQLDFTTSIDAGDRSACAVSDGAVWCWGYNEDAQLGDGTTTQRNTPVQIMPGAQSVSVSTYHACASGPTKARCWGSRAHVELGDGGKTPDELVPIDLNRVFAHGFEDETESEGPF